MAIPCGAPEGEENRADRVDRAAEQDKPDERQGVAAILPKRVDQHKAHPPEHHIKHHLHRLEALLVNVCEHRADSADNKAEHDHRKGERAVIRHNANEHQRDACALYEHIYHRMIDHPQHLLGVGRLDSVVDRGCGVKHHHRQAEYDGGEP